MPLQQSASPPILALYTAILLVSLAERPATAQTDDGFTPVTEHIARLQAPRLSTVALAKVDAFT